MTANGDTDGVGAERIKIRKVLIISQIIFFSCVALCYLLNHGAMAQTDGISFYGVYHETIEILIIGYAAAAIGLWRLSDYFRSVRLSPITYVSLRLVSISLFGLLVTPYNKGSFLNWSHMTFGILGALLQLEITYNLMKGGFSVANVAGMALQLLGGVIGAASLPDWHFSGLLWGEIIFQVGFASSLLLSLRTKSASGRASARLSSSTT